MPPRHTKSEFASNYLPAWMIGKNPNLKITPAELRELFDFATSKTNFIFQGVIYDQVDGISLMPYTMLATARDSL